MRKQVSLVAAALAIASTAHAGDPLNLQVGADEGQCVKLVTGGPRGCGQVPSGIPAGLPAQVWHVPWQEGGWAPGGKFLWPINNHGHPVARPEGAIPLTVMDHSILIVYGPDGKTPIMIGEFLPEAEGNWGVRRPGGRKFGEYILQLRMGKLAPGPIGTTNGNPVGATYGLGDNSCTNTANAQLSNITGGGRPGRGLNWLGYQSNRLGVTPFIRDNWGRGCDAARYCNYRFGPTIASAGPAVPDMVNNGMAMGQGGFQFGSNLTGMLTDDPLARDVGGGAGAAWFGTIGVEYAYFTNTGGQLLLPARFSPVYYTGRGVQLCAQGGRALATNPLTAVAAGGIYLNYEANNYRLAVNDLTAMDDLSGISEDEFDAMIPYNIISGAYWRNVGSYYGLCDPLPPPRTVMRGRPRRLACGAGDVRNPNVDPPYEEGDEGGGCSAAGAGGSGMALGLLGLAFATRRRRARR
jgi:MYXO-CTERM domain-containing protein